MSKPEVVVTIDPNGEIEVEVNGVKGKGCEALSAPMEQALGVSLSNNKKPEYRQHAHEPAQQSQGH